MTLTFPSKRIRVVLAAKLRADWSAVVEVPADASDAELALLMNQFFHGIEMDEYVQDDEYWGQGECCVNDNVDDSERAEYRATRDAPGKLVYQKTSTHSQTLWCVVHGAAFVPAMHANRDAADTFKAQCGDTYVSGPWEVSVGQP